MRWFTPQCLGPRWRAVRSRSVEEILMPEMCKRKCIEENELARKEIKVDARWYSLNQSVPSSPLILSRAFTVSGKLKPEEAVAATLSSLPDEVVDTVGTGLPSEDSVSESRRKLEFLEMQEVLIKEEEKVEKAKLKDAGISEEDGALKEMIVPPGRKAEELAREKTLEKQEELCKISRALAVLASASSVSRECQEFLNLVNKEIELYNALLEEEGTEGQEEAKRAYRVARDKSDHAAEVAAADEVSSVLIDKPLRLKKIIEINPYMLGTMTGGGADCQFWHRNLGIKCRLHELANKRRISVTGSRFIFC